MSRVIARPTRYLRAFGSQALASGAAAVTRTTAARTAMRRWGRRREGIDHVVRPATPWATSSGGASDGCRDAPLTVRHDPSRVYETNLPVRPRRWGYWVPNTDWGLAPYSPDHASLRPGDPPGRARHRRLCASAPTVRSGALRTGRGRGACIATGCHPAADGDAHAHAAADRPASAHGRGPACAVARAVVHACPRPTATRYRAPRSPPRPEPRASRRLRPPVHLRLVCRRQHPDDEVHRHR